MTVVEAVQRKRCAHATEKTNPSVLYIRNGSACGSVARPEKDYQHAKKREYYSTGEDRVMAGKMIQRWAWDQLAHDLDSRRFGNVKLPRTGRADCSMKNGAEETERDLRPESRSSPS